MPPFKHNCLCVVFWPMFMLTPRGRWVRMCVIVLNVVHDGGPSGSLLRSWIRAAGRPVQVLGDALMPLLHQTTVLLSGHFLHLLCQSWLSKSYRQNISDFFILFDAVSFFRNMDPNTMNILILLILFSFKDASITFRHVPDVTTQSNFTPLSSRRSKLLLRPSFSTW